MNNELFKKIKENDLTIEEWLKMRVTEEYEKALMNKIDELQFNWNSLNEFVDYQLKHNVGSSAESSIRNHVYQEIKDKMNKLEGKNKE